MEGAEDVGHQGQLPYKSLWGEEAGAGAATVPGFSLEDPPGRGVVRKRRLCFTAGEGGSGLTPEGRGKWAHSWAHGSMWLPEPEGAQAPRMEFCLCILPTRVFHT